MTDLTGTLYGIENWGGECAAAYYIETEPGRYEPRWQSISRAEYARLRDEFSEFEVHATASMRFYNPDAQAKARSLEEYTDALNEQNDMAAGAAQGYL